MKKILIIDDEVSISKAYQDHLGRVGYDVAVAQDGAEGLRLAKSFLPDSILLDLVMPIMDGTSTLRALREDATLSQIPVLVLTNSASPDNIAEVLAIGGTEYYIKSDHSLADLVQKINKMLG